MSQTDHYSLEPGHIFFSSGNHVIRTVLGSCVAVCLWDRELGYGAMNHFLYPRIFDRTRATARFGNVATLKLVTMMQGAGSSAACMTAQIYGGAFPEGARGHNVGVDNVEVARRVLRKHAVRIVSEDVGGVLGRKILFDIQTGHVAVLKVNQLRLGDWAGEVWGK